MRGPLAIALAAALAVPAAAQQQEGSNRQVSQIAASVQYRLNQLGFYEVDARELSTSQLAAIHLQINSRDTAIGGLRRFNARQKVKVILAWE